MNQNEQSRVTVIVDGKQGINELGKLEMQASDLREQIKKLKTGTDEYVKANEKLDKVKSEMAGLRQEIGLSGLTMNQLNKYQLDLSREINNTVTKGTERYNELKTKLIEVRGVIQGQKDDIRGVAKVSEAAAGSIKALKDEAAKLDAEMELLGGDTAEFAAKAAQLQQVKAQLNDLTNAAKGIEKAVTPAAGSIKALKDEAAKLDAEMELLGGDTAEFAAKAAQLQQVKTQLNDLTNAAKGIEKAVTPAAGSIKALKDEAAKLDAELQLLEADTAEFTAKASQLQQVDARLKAATSAAKGLEVAQEGATGSMARLKAQAAALEKELSLLAPDTASFAAKLKELKAVEGQIGSVQNKMSGLSGAWKEFKSGALSMAGGVIGGNLMLMAAQKLADFIPNLINSQSKLSDSLADLRKTTGMSADEVKEFNKQLSKIDTRTPTEELRKIAIVAGQLGIAKKDILGFTTSVDRLVVALGDEFQGGAEEITKQVGALRNIFADIKSDNVSEDMLHIGNALNQLGAEGAATGPVMSDMASRIGGVGITLGLTSGQVLGLAATMQELNITSERGSTAVTKILQKMASAPQEFAVVAGMAAKDFKQLVDNDIYGALVKVVEGSNKTGTSATALAAILKELDVDGAGASEVFAKLGSNTELLAKKVNSATSALKGTDSIMNEFNIKNENMAAKMEKIGKAISKAFTFSSVSSAMEGLVNWVYKLVPAAEKQSEALEKERVNVRAVGLEILSLNVGNERRTKLINELKESYPDHLKNINAETSSNQELKKALDNVNHSLVQQIVIKKAGEELEAQLLIEADKKLELGRAREELRKKMDNLYTQGGKGVASMLALQQELTEKSISLEQQYMIVEQEASDGRIKGISRVNPFLESAREAVKKVQAAEVAYNLEKQKSGDLDKERIALLKALGIEEEKATTKKTTKGKETPEAADLDAARKIRDAKIALLTDEYEQKRQKLQAAAADEKANFEKTKATAGQIAEYKKLVEAKLHQDLIKLSHEKDRTIKDVELSVLGDTLRGKQQKLIEQATRDVKDFVGTEQQKAAYASAIEDKLMKDLADADAEYRKKALEEEQKLQKEKVEAAKKAKQQELDDATAFAELQVLVTQKDTDVMGFEVQKSEGIIRELKRRKYAELE
ncbi:phage tail tape measure protein, TP901 family, core region, partial [Flexibacter flexilis DSM 6793]